MKYYTLILIAFISCGQTSKHGVRRDNRKELIRIAKAAQLASGDMVSTFEIHMYGDTAIIHGDREIEYRLEKELPENRHMADLVKNGSMKQGVWYWAAPIGYQIGYNDYRWIVVRDTAFEQTGAWAMTDTVQLLELERIGILKRKCNCK